MSIGLSFGFRVLTVLDVLDMLSVRKVFRVFQVFRFQGVSAVNGFLVFWCGKVFKGRVSNV